MNKFNFLFLSIFLLVWAHNNKAHSSLRFGTFNLENFQATSYNPDEYEEHEGVKNKWYLQNVFNQIQADLIGLQEIKDEENLISFLKSFNSELKTILSQCGGSGRQKIGIAYNKNEFKLLDHWEESEMQFGSCNRGLRPALIADFRILRNRKKLRVINVHLKAGSSTNDLKKRREQHKQLKKIIQRTPKNYLLVVLGDFNSTEYLENPNNHPFKDFLTSTTLKNQKYPGLKLCSSYYSPRNMRSTGQLIGRNETLTPSLLDHILTNKKFNSNFRLKEKQVFGHCFQHDCKKVDSNEISDHYNEISDHCPIVKEYDFI